MSLGASIVGLWKRAPAWRFSVFGAVIATVVAVMSGGGGSGGNPTPPAPNPNQTTNNNSGQGGSGTAQNNQQQSCGPQGQASVSAPLVVSSTGSVPTNVSTPTGAQSSATGMPAAVQARFVQFITQVDAASREARIGERCVKMDGSVALLEATDYAYADCFDKGPEKLVSARECSADLAASEARFDRLKSAYEAVQDDRSGPKLEALASARSAMKPFDETRERWQTILPLVGEGDRAATEIAKSNQRIAKLESINAGIGTNPTPDQLQALANAGKLTALDRARLSPAQRAMLEDAEKANATLGDSDQRFTALRSALISGDTTDPGARDTLIRAVSQLTPFDVSRATPEQTAEIETARATAASFAMDDLLRNSASFDASTAPPSEFEKLKDLRTLLTRHGGIDTPTPEQQEALRIAQSAEVSLTQSDRRLARMREIVAQVEQGGPSELGDAVLLAYNDINPFDIARMSADDQNIYEDLEAARDVTMATEERLLTRDVPIFLQTDQSDQWLPEALDELRDGLKSSGFNIVTAKEQSAVTFRLSRSEIELKEVNLTGSTLRSAEVVLTLSGEWTFAGDSVEVPEALGDAVRGSPESLSRKAMKDAVEKLEGSLKKLSKGG